MSQYDEIDISTWIIADLRDEGYAICIFNPAELENADQTRVEDRLCELGWDVINDLQ